uniref:RWD domain-containing protein n=1 Tax=Corethron hystrix TaxID=216773 RepID=A0A7S1FQH5_9STRA
MNKQERITELKALRRDNRGTNAFEFLGPKVADATPSDPTRMRFHQPGPEPFVVLVEMPDGYPADAPPVFRVEGPALDRNRAAAIEDLLDEQAGYMPGMPCIATCLMALEGLDLAALDVGEVGRRRAIFKIDVVNNSKQFVKSLRSAANGSPCAYFYRTIECQNNAKFSFAVDPWRAVYCVCDAPDKKTAVDFMKTVRTDSAMDMDMLGKPGKIQMTVMEEFEMAPRAEAVGGDGFFEGTEYRTDVDLNGLMQHLMAAAARIHE